jgi:hypothetical protein
MKQQCSFPSYFNCALLALIFKAEAHVFNERADLETGKNYSLFKLMGMVSQIAYMPHR